MGGGIRTKTKKKKKKKQQKLIFLSLFKFKKLSNLKIFNRIEYCKTQKHLALLLLFKIRPRCVSKCVKSN